MAANNLEIIGVNPSSCLPLLLPERARVPAALLPPEVPTLLKDAALAFTVSSSPFFSFLSHTPLLFLSMCFWDVPDYVAQASPKHGCFCLSISSAGMTRHRHQHRFPHILLAPCSGLTVLEVGAELCL